MSYFGVVPSYYKAKKVSIINHYSIKVILEVCRKIDMLREKTIQEQDLNP